MTRSNRSLVRIRQQGQTLIIALIVMGVLLILGLVFLGLINRNILNAARSQRRSESADLAEAGIRYAHGQLVSSPLGADWRGTPVQYDPAATVSRDPDIYYLRPRVGAAAPNDLGGPDKLGPFVRVSFPGGRSLVRVRYGASDATPTPAVPGGPLRNPGAARSTLIIEAVGRPGNVVPSDPTTLTGQPLQFQGFANDGALTQGIAAMAQANGQIATSRRLVAFAPIGIIDAARFETNVFNSSAPIEMGIPDGLGITAFNDGNFPIPAVPTAANPDPRDVGANLSMQLGSPGTVATPGRRAERGFGSLIVNGDAKFHGRIDAFLNRTLGDSIRIAGRASAGNNAQLVVTPVEFTAGAYTTLPPVTLTDGGLLSFDSQDPTFNTAGGLYFDASPRTDAAGFASGVGRLVPPSILTVDPETKLNRYVVITRESGLNTGTGKNSGAYGHGRGVYVDNSADRQEAIDAEGRKAVGSQRSLFDDWLNPNSGVAESGWKGPFYAPRGAIVQLLPDGWSIQRDDLNWRNPDGSDASTKTIRYRIGRGTDNLVRIVNTLTFADRSRIDGLLAQADFDNGMPFDGVLYFEGNVRVRGTIPTGVQMTLVSNATIYIDGSIVKGITNNEITGGTRGQVIQVLPTASLMLMAKDNVAVNTSMFLGPEASQALESVNDVSGATGISPVRLRAAGDRLSLLTELVMDPNDPATGNPLASAQNWLPYALRYRRWDQNTFGVPTQLLLGHTMDDGTAAASFLAMNVNFGAGAAVDSRYFFNGVDPDGLITNTAASYTGSAGPTEIYGLGAEPWQRYSRFELRSFPLILDPANAGTTYNTNTGAITQAGVGYLLFSGQNDVLLRPAAIASVSSNDTLIGRAALAPSEIKIEASIFAEQGSFFIIPGPWFNPNPNDRHDAYKQRVDALVGSGLSQSEAEYRANRERLEAYGTAPSVPFYAEPLDVRVNIVGSVAENLPPPISVQAEWIRKWGWIPRRLGASGVGIPTQHIPAQPANYIQTRNFVPNLIIQYDPVLATGRVNEPGLAPTAPPIRTDVLNRPLPPMPRLPVSPRLSYFGEL